MRDIRLIQDLTSSPTTQSVEYTHYYLGHVFIYITVFLICLSLVTLCPIIVRLIYNNKSDNVQHMFDEEL